MQPSEREYTGPTQYFHNYEHDPEGLTHCRGPTNNPYRIVHQDGKHIINVEYAKGHGKMNKEQWFKFTKKAGMGWDLASGTKVEESEIPDSGKTKVSFNIDDKSILASKKDHDLIRDKLKILSPIPVKSREGMYGRYAKKKNARPEE